MLGSGSGHQGPETPPLLESSGSVGGKNLFMTPGFLPKASDGPRILFHMSRCSCGALHRKSSSEGAAGTLARHSSKLAPREGASAGLAQVGIQTTSSVHPLQSSRAPTRRMTAFSFLEEDLPFETLRRTLANPTTPRSDCSGRPASPSSVSIT